MTEITNALAGESRGNPEESASPIGEAAALVARLLSESDQPVRVHAEAPASIVPPEDPPEDRGSIPPVCPSVPLSANQNERPVTPQPSTRALLPYSKTTVAVILVVLAILIFGSGLAVGYAVLGDRSKAGSRSIVQENDPPAIRNTATPGSANDQASAPIAADTPPSNPAAELSDPTASILTPGHAEVGNQGNHNDLQSPPAGAASEQSGQAHALPQNRHVPADSSALDKELSIQPDSARPATHAATPPVNISPGHASTGGPQTAEPSAQTSHPERQAHSMRSENMLPATNAPQIPFASALPPIIIGASDARRVLDTQPDAPGPPAVTSPGHIEPSQLIHSEQPVYPQQAKKLHIEGDVQLRIVVAVDGTVRSVNLVSGPPLLAPAAIDAARGFRYKPAMLNGKPIETVQTIDMSFNLKN